MPTAREWAEDVESALPTDAIDEHGAKVLGFSRPILDLFVADMAPAVVSRAIL